VVMTADLDRIPIDTPVLMKPFTLQALTDIVRQALPPASWSPASLHPGGHISPPAASDDVPPAP
ncbi:MAG: hypothetical protein U0075_26645, partial [Thermomicrobiales bacterium]